MVSRAPTAAAPERSKTPPPDLHAAMHTLAALGNTTVDTLRAPESGLYTTALRQAFLLVMKYRTVNPGPRAAAIGRGVATADILEKTGALALRSDKSLVTRYVRRLCAVYNLDFEDVRARST
ncbi:MAG: hypothetical protein JWM46_902 [Candidatus Kaiserbacteria bacterium]|nr:hypothetical protein [Candidatus Kaiserbacteria bacterium]